MRQNYFSLWLRRIKHVEAGALMNFRWRHLSNFTDFKIACFYREGCTGLVLLAISNWGRWFHLLVSKLVRLSRCQRNWKCCQNTWLKKKSAVIHLHQKKKKGWKKTEMEWKLKLLKKIARKKKAPLKLTDSVVSMIVYYTSLRNICISFTWSYITKKPQNNPFVMNFAEWWNIVLRTYWQRT